MRYFKWLLLPFSWLYGLVMDIRNRLYDSGIVKSVQFDLAVIVIGNLTLGGSGKTPIVEYLIRLLKEKYKLAILSRGYKRTTRGFRIAESSDDAHTIGDEPFQLFRKFTPEISVCVGEDRAYSIPYILKNYPDTGVILLDDAYQHRSIRAGYQILVTDYNRLFYKDFVLPSGLLREFRKGASRSNVVIVTKCPQNISSSERSEIISNIYTYAGPGKPVFFAYIHYEKPQHFGVQKKQLTDKIILVSGIANAAPLYDFLQSRFEIIRHFRYSDHHYFTDRDVNRLIRFYENYRDQSVSILFTEKDIVRIINTPEENKLKEYPVFFLPITYKFVDHGKEFDQMILESLIKTGNYERK